MKNKKRGRGPGKLKREALWLRQNATQMQIASAIDACIGSGGNCSQLCICVGEACKCISLKNPAIAAARAAIG